MRKKTEYKIILVCVAIGIALIGIISACFDKNHAAYISLILTFIFLCFAFVDNISEFKASKTGFEAKTRSIIFEAESAVEGTHNLALLSSKVFLELLSNKMGWSDHYSPIDVEEIKEETISVLREMGIPMEAIKKHALSGWYSNVVSFYRERLTSYWVAACEEVQFEMKKLHDIKDEDLPTALRQTYSKLGITDRDEYINDFENIINTREHRRPNNWLDICKLECIK